MHCCLALVLALVAFATGSGYISGREYVYRYYGYVNTGFPDKKPQYSGLAYDTLVTVQPRGEYAVFKLDGSKVGVVNAEVEDVSSYPFEYKQPPDSLAQLISRPFRVYFRNGKVSQFEVSKDEPVFSVNLKRGLIALFNLHLDDGEAIGISDKDSETNKPYEGSDHYYKVFEDGVLGECETQYVIEHHPYHLNPEYNIVLNITKSRNYHRCIAAPNHYYSTFHGHECGKTEYERSHTLHGNAYYYYSIRGDRHHYVIEKVQTEGEIIYIPYPLEGQAADVYTNRTLLLLEERDAGQEYNVDGEVLTYNTLRFDIPFKKSFRGEIDLKKPHYLYDIYGKSAPVEKVERLLKDLVKVYDDESYKQNTKDKNYPALFLELVRAFSTLDYDTVDAIYKKHAIFPREQTTGEKLRYRHLLNDVLASTGTNPTILYTKNLIQSRKVTHHTALYYIQQLHLHVKEVSEALLDQIYELCEDEYVRQNVNVYAACYASLSNILYEKCVARYHPESEMPVDEYYCPDEVPQKYHEYIAQKLQETDEEYLKVVYLKAIGNLGVKESLKYLRPYVEGQGRETNYLRSSAIWAVKNVGFRHKELVKRLLVPLFYNRSENYEHRLAAFNILMMYRPGTYELESIARYLITEKDDQVRSFVYTTFRHAANSTHPCDRQTAEDVRFALHVLKHHDEELDKYDYSYSQNHYVAGYDPDYDFGGSTRLAYYASDTGYIPRTVYLGFNDYLGGKSMETFGIGFKQYGLEKFFDKLFGPEGAYGRRSVFDLFKKRTQRDISNVDKERREIQEKLNLPTKEYEPIRGEIFFKYMGNSLSFLYFNESTFESFFREGKFSIPDIVSQIGQLPQFSYQRFLLAVDKMYYIPSEGGLPIIFDYKQPMYYYHKNRELKVDVNPAFFADDRQGQRPTDVRVKVDGHFVFDKNMFASVGIARPYEQVIIGSGINRRSTVSLPVKLQLEVDLKEASTKIQWKPVVPHEVYHFHYEPYTFIRFYQKYVPVAQQQTYLPIRREAYRQRIHKRLFHEELGLGLRTYKDYDNEWNDFGSWFRFLTHKDYREKFYYLYANPQLEPYHYDAVLEEADEDPTTEVEAIFRYDYYQGQGEPKEERPVREFEEYDRSGSTNYVLASTIRGEVFARGPRERRVKGQITYARDLGRTYHKLSLYYDRTPFARYESEGLKICLSGYLKYPEYDIKRLATLDTVGMDRTVESKVKVNFGKDCATDKKIVVQGRFEESEEQRDLESRREEPDTVEHYNPYAYYYQKCVREKESGIPYPQGCIEYMYEATNVHKYTFHVKHENLTPRFLNATYKIGGFLRHVLYDHADHNVIDVTNPDDELHLEANFSAVYPVADIRVRKPRSESHYTHVHFPEYTPFRAYPFMEEVRTKRSFSDLYCLIQGENVFTFDRYSYNLPPIDCYKVIAKDCSPNEHFIILGSKISHPKYQKALKVILGKHKIEALPVSDDSGIIVRVDGKKVPVTASEPYFHYLADGKTPAFYIQLKGFYYALFSELYGLVVEYDGEFISVQVSPYYRSKLCGLCGNYNGQKFDGYINEKGCLIHDEKAYSYSFAIPSDTCSVPEVKLDCYGEGGAGCTELRTHVVQLTSGKVPQTCFSTEPVPQCRGECEAKSHVSKTVGFHCLPSKDDSTKKLLRQQQTRILYEVRRKSRDHEAEVQIPEGCYRP